MHPTSRYRIFFFLFATLLAACAGIDQRASDLIAVNYLTLSDVELRGYYQRLGDQLGRESSAARHSIGLIGKEEGKERMAALRQRWNEVREELQRRQRLE